MMMTTKEQAKILIIDYGMGNLSSVGNALEKLGCPYVISNSKEDIKAAPAYILPGVGAFGQAIENLKSLKIIELLTEEVIGRSKPLLGICLGMQLLAEDSVENGYHRGLGWIKGNVLKLEVPTDLRLPHVGWNAVQIQRAAPLFERVKQDAHYYFDHSYHLTCDSEYILATSNYGIEVIAAIQKENILAAQFHPEKSQVNGLRLLRNFSNYVNGRL